MICFFCDFVECVHCQDEAMIIEQNNKFLEIFSFTKSMYIKRALAYGFGVFSMLIQQDIYSKCIEKVANVNLINRC